MPSDAGTGGVVTAEQMAGWRKDAVETQNRGWGSQTARIHAGRLVHILDALAAATEAARVAEQERDALREAAEAYMHVMDGTGRWLDEFMLPRQWIEETSEARQRLRAALATQHQDGARDE